MPAPQSFTTTYGGVTNILVNEVSVHPYFDPASVKKPPTGKPCHVIWDTGATNSVITPEVVADLGLKPVSMTKVHTANGERVCNVYVVNIFLPNNVGMVGVNVTETELSNGINMLIGMDVISHGDFAVTNTGGKTTFSFRTPSSECIDFVRKGGGHAGGGSHTGKISRNAPCPCGSGKKYKRCHGK